MGADTHTGTREVRHPAGRQMVGTCPDGAGGPATPHAPPLPVVLSPRLAAEGPPRARFCLARIPMALPRLLPVPNEQSPGSPASGSPSPRVLRRPSWPWGATSPLARAASGSSRGGGSGSLWVQCTGQLRPVLLRTRGREAWLLPPPHPRLPRLPTTPSRQDPPSPGPCVLGPRGRKATAEGELAGGRAQRAGAGTGPRPAHFTRKGGGPRGPSGMEMSEMATEPEGRDCRDTDLSRCHLSLYLSSSPACRSLSEAAAALHGDGYLPESQSYRAGQRPSPGRETWWADGWSAGPPSWAEACGSQEEGGI